MSTATPAETVRAAAQAMHTIGTTMMVDPKTAERGASWGWNDPFAFYFAGRGGVLGDSEPDVITAAFGWFHPGVVAQKWKAGISVDGARGAASRYNEAVALWGRDNLAGAQGLDRIVELGERLINGAEGSGLPLFAGWRSEPRVTDAPGQAMQVMFVLREWRGAIHLAATTAVGLSPVEAILTNEGEGQAKFFGWPEPFADVTQLKNLHEKAEATTDQRCGEVQARILSPAENTEFAELVTAAQQLAAS
ncbi:MAG: SCO6745 family protein [Acidimicrobiia bacterium]